MSLAISTAVFSALVFLTLFVHRRARRRVDLPAANVGALATQIVRKLKDSGDVTPVLSRARLQRKGAEAAR